MPYAAALKVQQIIEVEYIFASEDEAKLMMTAMHEPGFVGSTGSRLADISRKALKAETDALLSTLPIEPLSGASNA